MAGSKDSQRTPRFQAWGDQKNDGGPDWQEKTEKGSQLVGKETKFILNLRYCSDTHLGFQGSSRT